MSIVKFESIEDKIIEIRGEKVILDQGYSLDSTYHNILCLSLCLQHSILWSNGLWLSEVHTPILDSDVAELYGVETRDINKSVKNNPDKFPNGYIFELTKKEFDDLRWKISTAKFAKTRILPKAFTEKGPSLTLRRTSTSRRQQHSELIRPEEKNY